MDCFEDDVISADNISLDQAQEIQSERETPGYSSAQKELGIFHSKREKKIIISMYITNYYEAIFDVHAEMIQHRLFFSV